jgi:nucleotide-binding universal stress UspA family protein
MIHKLLIAYDGSEPAKRAFDFALDLARRYGAELHVLAVAQPPEFGTEVESEAILETSRRHYGHVLKPIEKRLEGEPVEAKSGIAIGHPAEQIVLYAERHGIDHIVVGHRGHSMFERWLLGSIAKKVMSYASCTVTVVR